jgi:hypothetical protein
MRRTVFYTSEPQDLQIIAAACTISQQALPVQAPCIYLAILLERMSLSPSLTCQGTFSTQARRDTPLLGRCIASTVSFVDSDLLTPMSNIACPRNQQTRPLVLYILPGSHSLSVFSPDMTDDELADHIRRLLKLNALDARGSEGAASREAFLDVDLADLDR